MAIGELAAEAQGSGSLAGPAVVFVVIVLLFTSVSTRLRRWLVTAPLAFVAAGAVLGFLTDAVPLEGGDRIMVYLRVPAEVTLVLILFHDAAQVRPRELGNERAAVARLLLIGFPLTVGLGYAAALWLFPGIPVMLALLLAAALAPTDAGLGAPTVLNPVVPARVRRILNVESGLNDGLATPVALFAIGALAGEEGLGPAESLTQSLIELAVGVMVGALAGYGGALLLGGSRSAGFSSRHSRALGVLMIPLLAYGSAQLTGGNGFVAAFIAGTSFAGAARWINEEDSALALTEELADPLSYLVWLVFGFAAVPFVWDAVGWRELTFGLLALTVLRMVPVAVSLLGLGMRPPSLWFVGWFGPRGLASVIFGIIALEELAIDEALGSALATIAVTVVISVVAHGVSAQPLSVRYGAWVQDVRPAAELGVSAEPRTRGARSRVWQIQDGQPPAPRAD